MRFHRLVREALLERSRLVATSTVPKQLATYPKSTLLTSPFLCQQRYVSGRPSPFRQQMLAKQRKANNRSSAAADEAQKSAKNKTMLVSVNSVLYFGMAMYLMLFVDRYFQNREREIIQRVQEQLASEFTDMEEWDTKYQDHPVLCTCLVRLKSRELKDLFPVEIGDVVDVLVEGVGRDGTLNICRSRPQNPQQKPVTSLYPMGCLQRVNLENSNNNA